MAAARGWPSAVRPVLRCEYRLDFSNTKDTDRPVSCDSLQCAEEVETETDKKHKNCGGSSGS